MKEDNIRVTATPAEQALLLGVKEKIDEGAAALRSERFEQAAACFEAAASRAPDGHSARDVALHNLLTAHKQWIEKRLADEDRAGFDAQLQRLFERKPNGPLAGQAAFRERYAEVFIDLSKALYRSQHWDAALACARQAIAISPSPAYYVDLTNALAFARKPARIQDYLPGASPNELGRHVFIACAPKSGSTFLKKLLLEATGFRDVFSVYAGLQNEQDLDLPQLAQFARNDTVTQQHCRASEANIHLMQAFGIRPLVLVRDIFDTAMSLRDFYDGGFVYSTFFERDRYIALDDRQRLDLIIDFVVPWYFQFVASWQRAERDQRLNVMWVDYADVVGQTEHTLRTILAFHGLDLSDERVRQVIDARVRDKRGNRFNRGTAGRGSTGLDAEQRSRIVSLARHFPGVDFSRLGLPSET